MANSLLLDGKVAVITGGGSGIGRAMCKIFASEGASIIAVDVDENSVKKTIESISDGKKHFAQVVDVSQSESVSSLISKMKQECPTPHILVNCAGITRDVIMLEMTEAMFDDVIRVNLKGTYLMTQAISKLMIDSEVQDGSIVNISSISGKTGYLGQCNYAASKAGVEGFTKTVAKELAQYNIRCNAVMPGAIDTPLLNKVPIEYMDYIKKEIPLKRLGRPEEIANVCAFLASNKSSYMTGSIIQVSGGLVM